MRIGFDAKRAFQNSTGLGNYSRDVIRLFSNRMPDHEFFLFDPKGSGIKFEFNKFNTHVISSNRKTSIGKALWRSYNLKRQVDHLHLDVFHGLSNELPVGISKSGAKTLVTIHDLIYEKHPEWYPKLDRTIYRKKVKAAIEAADVVIAISQQTKQDLVEEYNVELQKVEVVYQGCAPIFSMKQPEALITQNLASFNLPADFVLYVGTIEERKNLHRLVEALANTDIPLVAVGKKTPYFEQVESALDAANMKDRFFHLQNVSFEQLASLYRKARVFVYPSLYEGFGIPVIESLHSGTPVVTGKGCLQEALGKGGLSVDVTKPEEINKAILNIWNDDEKIAELRMFGFEHIKQFTDDALWKRWESIYKKL